MALPTDPYNFTNGATADAEEVDARFAALYAALAAGGLDAEALASQAWTAWTPTITTIVGGSNVITARSMKLGRTVHLQAQITLGAGGAFTGTTDLTITAPYTAANTIGMLGSAYGYDTSAVAYAPGIVTIAPNTATMRPRLIGGASPQPVSATLPWTWAEGDILYLALTYEAAS